MFKKPADVEVSRQSLLGGKDVKKLLKDLKAKLRLDDDGVLELFPGKQISKTKLSLGCVVYLNSDGNPMILDPSNDHLDVAVPTLYALALVPDLVPSIEVNGCPVSTAMMRGADLFLKGFSDESLAEDFLAGQIRAVRVPGNPVPFAVGKMAVSNTEARMSGYTGRGLTSMHYYGDELWKIGDRIAPSGFTATSVEPLAGRPMDQDGLAADLDTKMTLGADEGEQEGAPTTDDIIYNACIGALKDVRAGELPLTIDVFLTKKMTPLAKSAGLPSLDMKRSKWKRGAKLLEEFAQQHMCVLKNVRRELSIVEINRDHPSLTGYSPLQLAGDENANGRSKDDPIATTVTMFKSPNVFLELLGLDHKSIMISESDVDARLTQYLASYDAPGVDEFLLNELWGKREKEGVDPKSVAYEEVKSRLLGKLSRVNLFTRLDPETGQKITIQVSGKMEPLRLTVLKRQGRLMTTVTGYQGYGYDGKSLADELARRMKTNCFTSSAEESKSGMAEVCLMGDWVSKRTGDHYLPTFFLEHGLTKAMLAIDTTKAKKK